MDFAGTTKTESSDLKSLDLKAPLHAGVIGLMNSLQTGQNVMSRESLPQRRGCENGFNPGAEK
jgi:hypothetical protein